MNLYREYWRDKVPTCLKGKPEVLDNCVNPSLYLTLVNPTKAPSLGTCNCSAQIKVKKKKRKLPEVKGNTNWPEINPTPYFWYRADNIYYLSKKQIQQTKVNF